MSIDHIYDYIGGAGVYQILLLIILSLPAFYGGYQTLIMVFVGAEQEHWCKINRLQNFSHDQQKYIAIPFNKESNQFEKCTYFDLPYNTYTDEELWNWNRTSFDEGNTVVKSCNTWIYDQSEYISTVTSQFNLVCSKSLLVSLTSSFIFVGFVFSELFSIYMIHRYGRRPALLLSSVLLGPLSILCAFSPNIYIFILFRVLISFANAMGVQSAFTYTIEVFGIKERNLAGSFYFISWGLGVMFIPLIAYFVRDFFYLQLILSVCGFSLYINFFMVLESPRWLIINGKETELKETCKLIGEINNKVYNSLDVDKIIAQNKEIKGDKKANFVDFFKDPVIRKRFLMLIYPFVGAAVVYYGIVFNAEFVGPNVYIVLVLQGLVECLSLFFSYFIVRKFGRRTLLIIMFLLSGTFCLVGITFANDRSNYIGLVMALSGKSAIIIAWCVLLIFNTELFPTQYRHIAMPFCSIIANIGSIAAPFTGPPLVAIWSGLPMLVYGIFGVLSCVIFIFLPETKDKELPDFVTEIFEHSITQTKL